MCRAGWKPKTRAWAQSRWSSAPGRATAGFTLIELMVVVVVMAILAGAIGPSVASAVRRTGVESVAERTATLLDFARAAAIARREVVSVNFDMDRQAAWASVRRTALPWLTAEEENVTQTLGFVKLPEGMQVTISRESATTLETESTSALQAVQFDPDGTMEDAVVELTEANGDVRYIQMISGTGEILVLTERQ